MCTSFTARERYTGVLVGKMHEEIQIYVHKFHGWISQCGFFVHTARTFWEYLVALVNRIRVGLVGKVVFIGAP